MDRDYYNVTEGFYRIVLCCLSIIFALLICLMLTGCKLWKTGVSEKTEDRDSVRIEYREKVVKVPVTVYVEVPVEVKERFSRDSASHLETTFAVSDAEMVWIDGVAFLRHSLANKAQKIQKTDSVQVVEKEKVVWKTRRVTYTKTEIRQAVVPWWQKGLMYIGIFFIIIVLVFIISKLKFLSRW